MPGFTPPPAEPSIHKTEVAWEFHFFSFLFWNHERNTFEFWPMKSLERNNGYERLRKVTNGYPWRKCIRICCKVKCLRHKSTCWWANTVVYLKKIVRVLTCKSVINLHDVYGLSHFQTLHNGHGWIVFSFYKQWKSRLSFLFKTFNQWKSRTVLCSPMRTLECFCFFEAMEACKFEFLQM